jgi:hypothetical protein
LRVSAENRPHVFSPPIFKNYVINERGRSAENVPSFHFFGWTCLASYSLSPFAAKLTQAAPLKWGERARERKLAVKFAVGFAGSSRHMAANGHEPKRGWPFTEGS